MPYLVYALTDTHWLEGWEEIVEYQVPEHIGFEVRQDLALARCNGEHCIVGRVEGLGDCWLPVSQFWHGFLEQIPGVNV